MDQAASTKSERDGRQLLRVAIGPSPWGLPAQFNVLGRTFSFVDTGPRDRAPPGMKSLQDATGATLLVVDFDCYARILNDGTVLFWRELGDKVGRRIVFDCFSIFSLQHVSDPFATAAEIRQQGLRIGPLPTSQHWELSPMLEPGVHGISVPHDWSRFVETLVLTDHTDANGCSRAIFAFDWEKRKVEVLPQDWFNQGNYDLGYQWITRVARCDDGSIVGDGIRLGKFELDKTNRQIKRWLSREPFYMLQGDLLQS